MVSKTKLHLSLFDVELNSFVVAGLQIKSDLKNMTNFHAQKKNLHSSFPG